MFVNGTATFQDSAQSKYLGDRYFIAGISAMAEYSERLKKAFVIQEMNKSGILAFNMWVKGIPVVVTIDDILPFESVSGISKPFFSDIGLNGALWGPLLEKVWAKINGNYERTAAGW